MSEPSRALADRIGRDLSTVSWPEPGKIRDRGRWRSARTAFVATTAVVLVVAAVWAAGRALPFNDAAPPANPPATTIPREALLQPDDLGPGRIMTGESTDEERRTTLALDVLGPCFITHSATPYAGENYYQYVVKRGWRIEVLGARTDETEEVQETVYRFAGGAAHDAVADLRSLVVGCPEEARAVEQTGRPGTATTRYTVPAENFAGDESLLIRRHMVFVDPTDVDHPIVSVFHFAVVRVDNLVAVITVLTDDGARMVQLATLAAQRLCIATPRC